tara:strand:- start:1430 stop:1594 length:165 start_codon:yes stop_codon:yes gene_type:complete
MKQIAVIEIFNDGHKEYYQTVDADSSYYRNPTAVRDTSPFLQRLYRWFRQQLKK